jgi:ubiquinone biosynthesis protein UbiJ
MIVQIPGTTLVRDTTSMALINQDKNGLDDYLKKRQTMVAQKEEINKVKSEISEVKDDLKELKLMIAQLLSKGSNV